MKKFGQRARRTLHPMKFQLVNHILKDTTSGPDRKRSDDRRVVNATDTERVWLSAQNTAHKWFMSDVIFTIIT